MLQAGGCRQGAYCVVNPGGSALSGMAVSSPSLTPEGGTALERYLDEAGGWRSGRVEVFFDRPALAMALRTLRAARVSIDMEMFLFGGRLGLRVLRLLDRKARAGVRVRLLHRECLAARVGAVLKAALRRVHRFEGDRPEHHYVPLVDRLFATELRKSRVERRRFPVHLFRNRSLSPLKIAHDKLLLVDGSVAVTGGMNLATAVAGNHDVMIRVTGDAVTAATAVFDYDWRLAANPATPWPADAAGSPRGTACPHRLRFAVTRPARSEQLELVLGLLRHASRRIWVEMFLLTDPRIVAALVEARARGVDVRMIADSMEFALGIRLHGAPNLPFVRDLTDGGVAVRVFRSTPGRQMHQKSLVVDGRWVLTGTTNFTRQAFEVNTESSFLVEGADVAAIYERRFLDDWLRRSGTPDPTLFSRRQVWFGVARQACRWL